jgi:putative tryptophan/tyrosine transport system substrate-binding protein
MHRREFLGVLAGAAAALPLAAQAQQPERMRRIGVLFGGPNDADFRSKLAAFQQTLQQFGWVEGRNIEFDIRWGSNDADRVLQEAHELVRVKPDVILVGPTNALVPLKKETESIPIVFVQVSDPLGRGIVKSIARPTGNVTGFSNLEFSLIGKYLQILKEIAPITKRVAVMIHTSNAVSANWFSMFNTVAPSFAIEPITAPVRDRADIGQTIELLAREAGGGLILPGDTYVDNPDVRKFIVGLAASHRLPALYTNPEFARDGGLMSYYLDVLDQYRGAASYVNRILKGETPADLPVQAPTRFELVINLKTARALGLTVPLTLQTSADEVIE